MTTHYEPDSRPYRGSVPADNLLFLSGRIGMLDGTLPEGVPGQTAQAVRNVDAELAQHGLTLNDIVKATVYLDNMANYDTMNRAYLDAMPTPLPARTCIGVDALPYGGLVEIDVIAYRAPLGEVRAHLI